MLEKSTQSFAQKDYFARAYEVELNADLPPTSGGKVLRFPPQRLSSATSLVVKVSPYDATPWWGIFAGDYPRALRAVFSCPSAHHLCVVVGGQGYVVDAYNPSQWELVPAYPIVGYLVSTERRLLILHDFSRVVAYGTQGLRWKTADLGCDGMQARLASANELELRGWCAGQEKIIRVDLESGALL